MPTNRSVLGRWMQTLRNRLWCARHGHEDLLWHVHQEDPTIDPHCPDCFTPLCACADPEAHAVETAAPL